MAAPYIYALITLLSWTISIFINAKLSRLETAWTLNKAILFVSIVILGIVVFIKDRLNFAELFTLPTYSEWILLATSGVIGKSLGDYCALSCIRILGARRRSVITTLTPGFVLIASYFILKENINIIGSAGVLITGLSLVLLINSSTEKEEVIKENFGSIQIGFLMGISAALFTALAFVISKKSFTRELQPVSEFHATWIRVFSAFLFNAVIDLFKPHTSFAFLSAITNPVKFRLILLNTFFYTVLGLSFSLMAITRMNVTTAVMIFNLTPVTVTIASLIFLKKKISLLSWTYSILAVIGALLVIYRGSI